MSMMIDLPSDVLLLILNQCCMSAVRLVCHLFESVTHTTFILNPKRIRSQEALLLRGMKVPGGIVMKDISGAIFDFKGVTSIAALWRGKHKARRGTRPIKRTWVVGEESSTTKCSDNMNQVLRLLSESNVTYIPDDETVERILMYRISKMQMVIPNGLLPVLMAREKVRYNKTRSQIKWK